MNTSSATKLLKARQEYIKLATTNNSGNHAGPRDQLRMQAYLHLSATYDEYVKKHGEPNT